MPYIYLIDPPPISSLRTFHDRLVEVVDKDRPRRFERNNLVALKMRGMTKPFWGWTRQLRPVSIDV